MLTVNSILKWCDEPNPRWERVLWVDQIKVAVIMLDTDQGVPFWRVTADLDAAFLNGDVVLEAADKWLPPPDGDRVGPADDPGTREKLQRRHQLRDEAWSVIGEMVDPPNCEILIKESRGKMIQNCIARTGRKKCVIYAYLRNYWQLGQTKNALLPGFHLCGGPGGRRVSEKKLGRPRRNPTLTGANLTDDTRIAFQFGFKKHYKTQKKSPLYHVYTKIMGEYFFSGDEIHDGLEIPIIRGPDELPTYGQFRYWVHTETDVVATKKARVGNRKFALRYRGLTGGGSTALAFGPGSLYQIDSTMADIRLLSLARKGKIAGRPTLYLIVDVFSRLIVGYHLTFDAPSYLCASLALENAACDKVAHCAELGIAILEEEWPSHHLPATALADRGELKGKQANIWPDALGVRLDNTPPYRADFKAIVERSFGLLGDTVLRWLPGHVEKEVERGDRDTRLDAMLTLLDFRRLVVKWILFHNRRWMPGYPQDEFQIAADVLPIPTQLWAWGVAAGTRDLKTRSKDDLYYNLLPGAKASICEDGIHYGGLTFINDRFIKEEWGARARIVGRTPINISFDPRGARTIYLRPRDGGEIEPFNLTEKDKLFANCSWAEVKAELDARKDAKEAAKHDEMQQKIELDAYIDHMLKEKKGVGPEGRTKSEKVGGMDETRKAERAAEHELARSQHPADDGKIIPISSSASAKTETGSQEPLQGQYVGPANNTNLFRKKKTDSTAPSGEK